MFFCAELVMIASSYCVTIYTLGDDDEEYEELDGNHTGEVFSIFGGAYLQAGFGWGEQFLL
jgi:hypothetical protein